MSSSNESSRSLSVALCAASSLWLGVIAACGSGEPAAAAAVGAGGTAGLATAGVAGAGGMPLAPAVAGSPATAGTTSAAGGVASGGAAGAAGAGGQSVSGASGAAGAGGGAGLYNPCPTDGSACRVMPLGDSITEGGGVHGCGYRYELFRMSLREQKKLTYVGSKANGPELVEGQPFPRNAEGHSGWAIDDGGGREGLYPQIVGWLNATAPHIITLMIGTNDVLSNIDRDNAPARLGLLLDRIIATAPSALVVVAQIIPTTDPVYNELIKPYNAMLPAVVTQRAQAGKHVVLVDMYQAFVQNPDFATAYFMADKVHPADGGLEVMANTWWSAIGDFLPN